MRIASATGRRLTGAAMRAGLMRYRPVAEVDASGWDNSYESDDWGHLGGLSELSRYSVLVGYVRFFGPARRILDVGCGSGVLLERLGPDDFEQYLGVDISSSAIARARHLQDQDRISFAVGELPSRSDGPFQFVVCNEMLYYALDPASTIRGLHALTEPGGYLLTSIWHHRGDAALRRIIGRHFELVDGVNLEALTGRTSRTRVACWQPRTVSSLYRATRPRRNR